MQQRVRRFVPQIDFEVGADLRKHLARPAVFDVQSTAIRRLRIARIQIGCICRLIRRTDTARPARASAQRSTCEPGRFADWPDRRAAADRGQDESRRGNETSRPAVDRPNPPPRQSTPPKPYTALSAQIVRIQRTQHRPCGTGKRSLPVQNRELASPIEVVLNRGNPLPAVGARKSQRGRMIAAAQKRQVLAHAAVASVILAGSQGGQAHFSASRSIVVLPAESRKMSQTPPKWQTTCSRPRNETDSMNEPGFIFITCQIGAEAAVKGELARDWPALRFAYSRPGFLTFKLVGEHGLDEKCDVQSVFARAAAFSLGKAAGASDRRAGCATCGNWPRDGASIGCMSGSAICFRPSTAACNRPSRRRS